MDQIENQLKSLLNGGGLPEENYCDFTLADQNEALGDNYSYINT